LDKLLEPTSSEFYCGMLLHSYRIVHGTSTRHGYYTLTTRG